jgi:hypothetical protein
MPRPDFVTNEDIARWSENIDNDPRLSPALKEQAIIREICYAGLWLTEELEKLKCPEEMIVRIQYTAGKLSYGRDIWEVHQMILDGYKLNEIEFEMDPSELN